MTDPKQLELFDEEQRIDREAIEGITRDRLARVAVLLEARARLHYTRRELGITGYEPYTLTFDELNRALQIHGLHVVAEEVA
jgi:hypothetical protein